jgi:predicted transcriptional regulator YheO
VRVKCTDPDHRKCVPVIVRRVFTSSVEVVIHHFFENADGRAQQMLNQPATGKQFDAAWAEAKQAAKDRKARMASIEAGKDED